MLTDQNVKDSLDKGMSVIEIALKYDLAPITVLRRIKQIEKEEKIQKAGPQTQQAITFNLEVGDKISAYEQEISKKKNIYEITGIYKHIYTAKKISGHGTWTTAFGKEEYRKESDLSCVKLVSKGGAGVEK